MKKTKFVLMIFFIINIVSNSQNDKALAYNHIENMAINEIVKYTIEEIDENTKEVEFIVVNQNNVAGEFFIINVLNLKSDQIPSAKSKTLKNLMFFKTNKGYTLIIPLDYYQKKYKHKIEFYITENMKTNLVKTEYLIVDNTEFSKQYLTIDKKIAASTKNDKSSEEYEKIFTPIRDVSSLNPYFDDTFIMPVKGRISTEFGMSRYVNGSITSYRHSGIDIAAKKGTKILATNRGKVILSTSLIMTGNTVVLDHGMGIFSVYFHMDKIEVKNGEIVEKAGVIGTVGNTGFSTGAHLHFTMSYYKTNINPDFLFNLSKEDIERLIN